jgi:hypothetical protein
MSMAMPANTLFVAQLEGRQVAGGSSSGATGTGVFLLDPVRRTLEYQVTYQGLETGGANSVALHNFGKGKDGKVVRILCGPGAQPCPASVSATLSGRFERDEGGSLDNAMIGEFDSGRVYVEVVGSDGKAEIRGQLGANGAMVMFTSYIARLAPIEGTGSKGSGTAVVSETYLPGGKVAVFYAATVAGTSGAPVVAALAASPAKEAARRTLPKLELRYSRDRETGGTLTGSYEVSKGAPGAVLVSGLRPGGHANAGIVVTTSRFPSGELFGVLTPVR